MLGFAVVTNKPSHLRNVPWENVSYFPVQSPSKGDCPLRGNSAVQAASMLCSSIHLNLWCLWIPRHQGTEFLRNSFPLLTAKQMWGNECFCLQLTARANHLHLQSRLQNLAAHPGRREYTWSDLLINLRDSLEGGHQCSVSQF